MKRKHNCWKVINARTRRSSRLNSRSPWALTYPVEKAVRPLRKSKLFVFRTRDLARYFCSWRTTFNDPVRDKMCRAYGKNLQPAYMRSSGLSDRCLRRFWRSIENPSASRINRAPEGTMWADEVTCLE